MPRIFEPNDLPVTENNRANIVTLANQAMLGTNALQIERILLQPGTETDLYPPIEGERFLYVIRGKGNAHVEEQSFVLDTESVLWLEKRDAFSLQAQKEALDVLLCHAPTSD